jgi:hypothetical protein
MAGRDLADDLRAGLIDQRLTDSRPLTVLEALDLGEAQWGADEAEQDRGWRAIWARLDEEVQDELVRVIKEELQLRRAES